MFLRKIALICALIFTIVLLTAGAATANIIVETKYSVTNPDEKWHISEARLHTILPSEDDKEYCKIIEDDNKKQIKFNKKPAKYLTDAKGNQFATYYYPYIAAGHTKDFKVAALYEEPVKIPQELAEKSYLDNKLYDISYSLEQVEENVYLQPSNKIESDSSDIQNTALYLVEDVAGIDPDNYNHDKAYEIVKAIFEYVSAYKISDGNYENYDSPKANQGALSAWEVINNNTGDYIVCEDYASLMVALLRSLQEEGIYIPARTVSGFKIPEYKMPDVPGESLDPEEMEKYRHMWVEYLVDVDSDGDGIIDEEKKWLVADPTPSYINNGTQFEDNLYFADTDAYYIHDSYDATDPANLFYRGYTKLTEGEDFKYEYTLKYSDASSLDNIPASEVENREYEDFVYKPSIDLNLLNGSSGNDSDTIYLKPDQIGFLTINLRKSSFDKMDSLKWVSTDPTVVRIDNNYLVPAINDGSAEIYAVINGVKSQVKRVEITPDAETVDKLNQVITKLEQVTLYPGRKFELPTLKSAEISGGDGPSLRWWVETGDEGIVRISDNELEALQEGFATIYAELNGVKKSVDVRVLAEARVAEVVINHLGSDQFLVGKPSRIQVVVYVWGNDGDKTPIANLPVELEAENPEVVEINVIDEEKRIYEVTPLQFQTTNLIANARGIEGTMEVDPKEIENLRIEELDKQQLKINEEATFTVVTDDSDYKDIIENIPLEWIYDTEVISVEGEEGSFKLVAQGPGTTTLQARAGNTRSYPVTIAVELPDLKSLEIELDDERIKLGETITMTIVAKDENGEEYDLTNQVVTISSQYEDIVEIIPTEDNAVYEITGLKEGSTRITAKAGGLTTEPKQVEVYKPRPVELKMIIPADELVIGEIMEVSLEAKDQDGDDFDLAKSSIDLVLSRDDIVDVSNDGFKQIFIEGKKIGAFAMYADVQGVQSNTENIAVIPADTKITKIEDEDNNNLLNRAEEDRTIMLGQEIDIYASAYDKDEDKLDLTNLTAGIEWKVEDPDVLEIKQEKIDDTGEDSIISLKAVGIGETYVSASILGVKSARVKVQVVPELKYTVEKFKINFGLSKLFMNVGDKVRISPYDNQETVSGQIFNPDESVVEVKDAGHGAIIEAVGQGSVELYWKDLDGNYTSDKLVVIVGDPDNKVFVGELMYDIREKSMLPSIPKEPQEVVFKDAKNHWAKDDIALAYQLGIVGGYEGNIFKPNKPITRAEFATIFANALGLEVKETSTSFRDLEGHWSKNKVEALRELGIIGGYSDGTFKPDKEITRAEVAAIIAKSLAAHSSAENWFNDIDSTNWAASYINKVAGLGLVNGVGDGKFAPNKNTTRAEAITLIMRMLRGLSR